MNEMWKAEEEAKTKRFVALKELAMAQGLALVKMSARKYAVVQIDTARQSSHYTLVEAQPGRQRYYTWLNGTMDFAGTYAACQKFIASKSQPVPFELTATNSRQPLGSPS
jgi:hypothetical protein